MNISRDQFIAAYGNLPVPVREYMAGPELSELIKAMGTEHGLHVDILGSLQRVVGYMVVGLVNPAQFMNELQEMGIDDSTSAAIAQELNEKLFKPLRSKFREETEASGDQTKTREPLVPVPAPLEVTAPVPSYQPPTPIPAPAPAPAPAPQNASPVRGLPPPPTNLPGAEVGETIPANVPSISVVSPSIQPNNSQMPPGPRPVLKEYGVDPYREVPE